MTAALSKNTLCLIIALYGQTNSGISCKELFKQRGIKHTAHDAHVYRFRILMCRHPWHPCPQAPSPRSFRLSLPRFIPHLQQARAWNEAETVSA